MNVELQLEVRKSTNKLYFRLNLKRSIEVILVNRILCVYTVVISSMILVTADHFARSWYGLQSMKGAEPETKPRLRRFWESMILHYLFMCERTFIVLTVLKLGPFKKI